MADLGAYVLAGIAIATLGYMYVRIFERAGLLPALFGTSLMVDLFTLMLILLGIDRPWLLLCTKLGCITITYATAFLSVKLPLTLYTGYKLVTHGRR